MHDWVEHQRPFFAVHEPRWQPHSLNILLVEDDPTLRRAMEMTFAHLGHVVVSATKAGDVAKLLEANAVDLVISDHRLPDGTSAEVMKTVKALAPSVPAIVMSGHLDSEAKQAAKDQGFAACITKPIDSGASTHRMPRAGQAALRRAVRTRGDLLVRSGGGF